MNDLLNKLSKLSNVEFAILFYQFVKKERRPFVLSYFDKKIFDIKDGPITIALAENLNYLKGDFEQAGKCPKCRIEISSWEKEAICPFCDSKVWLT